MQYTSGVYHHISGAFMSGHAIKIVVWGVDSQSKLPYWIVANSWGVDWGMNGFFWIKRGSNECEIEEYMYTANVQL
ncbi:Papain family cysteine protease [compost metagenome]